MAHKCRCRRIGVGQYSTGVATTPSPATHPHSILLPTVAATGLVGTGRNAPVTASSVSRLRRPIGGCRSIRRANGDARFGSGRPLLRGPVAPTAGWPDSADRPRSYWWDPSSPDSAWPNIACSAAVSASCSKRSPGSLTAMPPGAALPSTGPDFCWTTWVSSWAIVFCPAGTVGVVAARSEHDLVADGVGVGAHRRGRIRRRAARVESDVAEVVAQPRLHPSPQRRIQRAPTASADDVEDGRRRFLVGQELGRRLVAGGALEVQQPLSRHRRRQG